MCAAVMAATRRRMVLTALPSSASAVRWTATVSVAADRAYRLSGGRTRQSRERPIRTVGAPGGFRLTVVETGEARPADHVPLSVASAVGAVTRRQQGRGRPWRESPRARGIGLADDRRSQYSERKYHIGIKIIFFDLCLIISSRHSREGTGGKGRAPAAVGERAAGSTGRQVPASMARHHDNPRRWEDSCP